MARFKLYLAILMLSLTAQVVAQSPACQAPALKPLSPGANLFDDRQEAKLAAILHSNFEQEYKVIEDDALTGELQRVGDRLAASFPKTGIKFHYYIIDLSSANAISQPGGNIYVSRKLIALFRTEDELAGVLAHEMGHIVTHQGSVWFSRMMRDVLHVNKLGDDDDVEEKYNELLDSYKKDPAAFRRGASEGHEQIAADQVAVYALGASGYQVSTLPAFWDRFAENKGKKGNFFTDMTGSTTEGQRRFRDMLKNTSALSQDCIGKHSDTSAEDFSKWRTEVVTYEGIGHREKLDGLIARKELLPPLRSEMSRLKVSPNGKLLFAQDQASILILKREDLKVLFRIDADDAKSVSFSPDSSELSFYTLDAFTSPRVEVWDLEEKSLRGAYELRIPKGCNQAALSPNGEYFACVSPSLLGHDGGISFDLRILDVESGDVTCERKNFFTADVLSFYRHIIDLFGSDGVVSKELLVGALHFSPDSKYLLFGRKGIALGIEAANGNKLNLPGGIKDIMQDDFSFLDDGRIVGVAGGKGDKGAVYKFPSGEPVYTNLAMGLSYVEGATHGEYAILRPIKDSPAGIFDLKANKFIASSKRVAIDIYDNQLLKESAEGGIVTFNNELRKATGSVNIAEGPLGKVVAAGASQDLKFIAISGTARGAVWNIDGGQRIAHLRRFDGVEIDNAGTLLADFPEEGEVKRSFAQIDTVKNSATSFEADPNSKSKQVGPYLLSWIPAKKDDWKKNVTCQVKSIQGNTVLWQRNFPRGMPTYFVAPEVDSLTFVYEMEDSDAKDSIESNAELRKKVEALKTREHAYIIESYSLKSGKLTGVSAIDTGYGSFQIRDAFSAGHYLITEDSRDRVQVTNFESSRSWRVQSRSATATRDGKLMAASLGRGKLGIFDLEKSKQLDELDFTSRVAVARFSAEGDRLLVVTRDQKAYYFDTKAFRTHDSIAAK